MKIKVKILVIAIGFVSVFSSCSKPRYTEIGGNETIVKLLDNETGRVVIIIGGSERCFEYDLKTHQYISKDFVEVDSFQK